MNRRTISLKYFIAIVFVFGCTAGLLFSHYFNAPNELDQPIFGPITSGATPVTQTLTSDELATALSRHQADGSIIDQIVKLKIADITLAEKTVEPSRSVPLLGPAELHRSFFLCDTICELQDGSEQRIKIKTEKNHFHVTGKPKQ